MKSGEVITRFPPSPTGNLHIGGARTALFNFLFTRHHGGKIYLRLENTDGERSKPEYEKNILDSLQWLGIAFDSLPDDKQFWRQSERKEVYRSYLKKLVDSGNAYVSKERNPSPHENVVLLTEAVHLSHPKTDAEGLACLRLPDGSQGRQAKLQSFASHPLRDGESEMSGLLKKGGMREEVIRFKNPNKKISFGDLIRGKIEFDATELGDMVIAKSLHEPLYHLAVVIDDYEMGITHVIRGEDHISNTPRQILLQEALEFPRPEYAHIPLILAPDRSKLSKRHGAVSVTEYRDKGYLPEAFINYLAFLGWNPGTDREIFSQEELIQMFDLSKAQRGGAIFNEEKLRWFNKKYLERNGGAEVLLPHLPKELTINKTEAQKRALAEMLFERISVRGDIDADMKRDEFEYLLRAPVFEKGLLCWKGQTNEEIKKQLRAVLEILRKLSDAAFTKDEVTAAVLPHAEAMGKGNVLWPMRVSLSGRDKSPDPFTLAAILGQRETLSRLTVALNMLK